MPVIILDFIGLPLVFNNGIIINFGYEKISDYRDILFPVSYSQIFGVYTSVITSKLADAQNSTFCIKQFCLSSFTIFNYDDTTKFWFAFGI